MMIFFSAVILGLLISSSALGGNVIKISDSKKHFVVSKTSADTLAEDDHVCVIHNGAETICGIVINVTEAGAVVRVIRNISKSTKIKVGDPVQVIRAGDVKGEEFPEDLDNYSKQKTRKRHSRWSGAWRDNYPRWFSHLRLGAVGAYQNFYGYLYGVEYSWDPTYRLSRYFGFRVSLALSVFKAVSNSDIFLVGNYQGFLFLDAQGLIIEAGGGGQTFVEHGGTEYIGSVNLLIPLSTVISAYVGYTVRLLPHNQVHQAKLGVELGF